MKINHLSCFLTTCALGLLVGCGGGGGGGVSYAPGTVAQIWSSAHGLNFPKHLTFLDGNLYVANNGADNILKIDSSGSVTVYSTVGEPLGIAPSGGSLFVTGRNTGTNLLGILQLMPAASAPNASIGANYYGLAFTASKAYVVDGSSVNIFNASTWAPAPTTSIAVTGSFHQALVANGTKLYVSNTDGTISVIDTSTDTLSANLSFVGNPFSRPNAMVLDGSGSMYVANAGDGNGDGGYISKVTLSNLDTSTFVNAAQVGLCGAAGLAISGGYLYVSNGTCSDSTLTHRILKIKI